MSLASCCDGPDCQPAPYGTGEAWYGLGVHNGGKWVQESLFFCLVLILFRVLNVAPWTNNKNLTHKLLCIGNDPYPCEGSYYPYNVRADVPFHLSPLAQNLACTEFTGCSSFGGDGTEFTGDNGFTVTDPNHPEDSWSSPSQLGQANTQNLACSEFTGCSSFGGDGTEFTGDNGFTVTDPNHPEVSWSSPSQLAETQALGTYTGPDGTVYTGDGIFTVTDNYTCNTTPCGSFTYVACVCVCVGGGLHTNASVWVLMSVSGSM